jgi:hypothetical protein
MQQRPIAGTDGDRWRRFTMARINDSALIEARPKFENAAFEGFAIFARKMR